MPASRSSTPSSTSATASQVGPALEGGPGHGHRAVAVGVGLHHGAQRGRGGHAAQQRGVVADGAPGRSRPTPGATRAVGARRPARRPGSPTADRRQPRPSRSARSPATRPSGGPRAAARPWTWAASAAASRRVEPAGHEGADDAGQHVAGAGRGQAGRARRGQQHRAAGVGHHGGRPLKQHHGPAARAPGPAAAAMRSAPGGPPARRANSPSWGVSTTGARPGAAGVRRGGGDGVARRRGRTGRRRRRRPGTGDPATSGAHLGRRSPSARPSPGPTTSGPAARPPWRGRRRPSPRAGRAAPRPRRRADRRGPRRGCPRRTMPAPAR